MKINGVMALERVRGFLAAAVMVAAAGVVTGAAPASAAAGDWQKGISIQSRYNTDFGSDSFKQSVRNAKADGVTFIMLIVPVHQDNIYASNVYAAGDTPTDAALSSGIGYVISQGMSAGIAIHDNPYDNQWRALINANDTSAWFTSYGNLLARYAGIAQGAGASQMILGTELSTMTRSGNTANWDALIRKVRTKFNGALTYSAQHAGYMGEVNQIGFWGSLDYVGISAYYSLYGRTDQAGMESAWGDWDKSEVSAIAAKTGKKVIFTEVGFVSRDGTTDDPGSAYGLGTGINTALQARAYEAMFNYWNKSSNLAGIFLWDWSSDPSAGGNNDGGYTPQGKPAEATMKKWYSNTSTTTPGMGGGPTTPTTPPATQPASVTYTAALNGQSVTTGSKATGSLSVKPSVAVSDMIVDIEIYNGSNRVVQTVYDHQNLSTSGNDFALNWTPSSTGTYTVKVGVFTANWAANTYWNDAVGTLTVTAPTAPSTPAPASAQPSTPTTLAPSPSPSPSQPSTPAPTQPTTPTTPPVVSLPTAISIWWPGANVSVSGVQPFKALIDNRDLSTYDMFWQVDGGTLNKMDDVRDNAPHKESSVDLTNWKWNANHQYVINFVTKDKSGTLISQKSVTITIP